MTNDSSSERIFIPACRSKSKSAQLRKWAEDHNALVLSADDAGRFPTFDGIAASKISLDEAGVVGQIPDAIGPLTRVEYYNATTDYEAWKQEAEKSFVPLIISCRCDWDDYCCYHLMLANGAGHVRVSFFDDEVVISDLFVREADRNKCLATYLLDEVDKLLDGRKATIHPLHDWQREWYQKRGYIVKQVNEQ